MKLTPIQAEMLIVIADNSDTDPEGRFWIPPHGEKTTWSETLGRNVFIDGSGCAAAIKALTRKGLIAHAPFRVGLSNPYQSRVTEEGRILVESWRETDSFPVARNA